MMGAMDKAIRELGPGERTSPLPAIEFCGVSMRYGDVLAVDNIDLEIEHGAFVSLLGPSGCGKTTSLRMIAGFERICPSRHRSGCRRRALGVAGIRS